MNKLSYLIMGFAALSFAACSSDEPTPAPTPGEGEGTTLYLNVNITDANTARSRAAGYDQEGQPKDPAQEGDYVFGNEDEHAINSADFLFYDKDGRFLTRTNIWQAGTGNDAPNIEYMGTNTLVLRNLSKNNLPTYVITVLNAPSNFASTVEANNWSMDETRMREFSILTGDNFVMSTTSFLDAEDQTRYDNAHYYATKLQDSDFLTEVPSAEDVNAKAVEIYVERLAAKFQLTGLNQNGIFPVDVTIAGEDNSSNGNVEGIPSASETVYVKILGYGLTGQEPASYLSKNLDGFAATDFWKGWNHPAFYRSYWAKSLSYDPNESRLTYSTFPQAKNDPSKAIYGYETTNDYTKIRVSDEDHTLIPSKVTQVLITARVYADAACTEELELVEYNGLYFKKDQYMNYVLGKLLAANGLQYWTNEELVESTTEEVENPDGSTTTITHEKYKYDALTAADFTCDWTKPAEGATGEIVITYTPADDVVLYKKPEGWKEGDRLVPATVEDVNKELAAFNATSTATAFRSGAMFYSVPIEHLVSTNQTKNYQVEEEGNYGIVRNHWYQLNVSKVLSLGHGVFKPGDIEGDDETEEIIPDDPKKERFALAAKINILSWKIVEQDIEL